MPLPTSPLCKSLWESNDGEFLSPVYFTPFPQNSNVFSQHLFYSIAIQLSALATLPWSIRGARACRRHPQLAYWVEWHWVSPYFILFLSQFLLFHRIFFELIANPAEHAALHQLIEGARASHCCLLPRLAYRRQQLWVFLSFLCSPCFLAATCFN